MRYRQANHEDLSYLVEFEHALNAEKPDSPLWQASSVLTNPLTPVENFTVAERADGVPVAMVASIPLGNDAWYLANLYVSPEYRGNGLARGLVDAAAAEQRRRGREAVVAIVADKVGDLYDRLGFKQVGRAMERVQ